MLKAASSLLPLSVLSGPAFGRAAYPNRVIRIVVGNAAGGTDDSISRFLANSVTGQLGQSVVVENRGGGSTTIAGATVAMASPDGYTLLCLISAGIAQTVLREKLRYGMNSFFPVIGVGGYPLALAVSTTAKTPIRGMDDLLVAARSPDGVMFANGGVGTIAHLTSVQFLNSIKGKGTDVAYRNNPEGLQALAGGYANMIFAAASEVAAMKGDGRVKVLAVTSEQRAINLPEIPTMRELGYPSINSSLWHGFVAPAGTPPEVVQVLADAFKKAVEDPTFQNRFKPMAFQENLKTGPALSEFITAEAARWRKVIAENNIRIAA